MGWDEADFENWLNEQDLLWGDDSQMTKDEWLVWASSMEWDRAEWESYN
jgi:hypothetical protein